MVKVTSPVTPSVQLPNNFAQAADVRYSPEMFGAQVGRSIAALGATLQESNQKDERFNALTSFSDFQTQTQLNFEKSQEDTPVNDGNFFDRTMADYDRDSAAFLQKVPPSLQKEFQFRSAQLKQGLAIKAYDFAFKQKGIFYNEKITDSLNKAQVNLNQNPNALEPTRKSIIDLINSTDLPEIEKEKQIRLANKALEAITYKSAIKANYASTFTSGEGLAAHDLPPEAGAVLNAIAGPESGGRYDIRFDGGAGAKITSFADHPRVQAHNPRNGTTSSAAGRYQDIESTWDAIVKATGVKDFSPANQDRGNWYWAQKTFRDATGGGDLTEALHAGEYAKIKKALGTQWEGVRTQSLEQFTKNLTSGTGTSYAKQRQIDDDPAFANLPFNERQSIISDAKSEATKDYNEQLKQIKAANDAQINDLFVGILDHKKGQQDIDNLRNQGIMTDFDDINKAQELLKKQNAEQDDFLRGQAKLDDGSIWDRQDTDDKKAANALFGKKGEEAINNRDEDYVQQTLLPQYQKMEMAAPDMANMLLAQTKLNNPESAAFAFETLRQMRERSPEAFAAQFPEALQKNLDMWETRKNFYSPEDLVNEIQGRGLDQATRQAQSMLRDQIHKEINDPNSSEYISLDDAARSYAPWIGRNAQVPLGPRAQTEFLADYRAQVEDNFVKTGDIETAKSLADKAMQRVWHSTDIGGRKRIMKFPPEVAGYKSFNGDYSWIDRSVREQVPALADGRDFELLADDTTEKEIAAKQEANRDVNAETGRPASGAPSGPTPGLLEQGNIDLNSRPVVNNADGTISTVRSISIEEDGKEILIPTVSPDGKILSDADAVALYHKTGQNLGKFNSAASADAYAERLHQAQAAYYQDQDTMPSYLIQYKDDQGLYRLVQTPSGQVARVNFQVTKADRIAAESEFNRKQDIADYNSIFGRYYAAKVIENQGGPKVDPSIEAEFNRMENERIERETTANTQNLHDIFGPIADRVKKAAQ